MAAAICGAGNGYRGCDEKLEALNPLAPLHQPHNLAAIAALSKLHPKLAQVACFDTSFHPTQSAIATAFALPRALSDKGVRRYGFHGLSYEYIASILPDTSVPRPKARLLSPISAMVRACAPCTDDKASRQPWALPRWMGW